jgi:N-sulfoglucosamine sulfohydrolase
MDRPNILYINSHDTGRYIQPYGHTVRTPHLRQLAEEGVLFRQAFCAGPTCSPSRAGLVTGQAPHSAGMLGLAHRGWGLHDYEQVLLHTLRAHGYRSYLAGTQHIANDWRAIGFDERLGDRGMEPACKFLESRPAQPFYLEVGFTHTHRDFDMPLDPHDDPRFLLPPRCLPDLPETREDFAHFCTEAAELDRRMGAVLAALEHSGLAANTLVICTTDHGPAFPLMKCNLTDHGIGVMLIIRGPGGFSGGSAVDGLVSQVDIFPTLCDLLDIARPPWLQGLSFLPLVRQGASQVREAVFAEVTYHAAYEPMRCVRTARHKYIRRYDGRTRPVLPNCDDSPSKTVLLDRGWRDQPRDQELLFDLVFDPQETCNIAARPEAAPVLAQMRERLDRWMEETDDPLRHGPVPAPPGARVNDPDGLSPREAPRVIA